MSLGTTQKEVSNGRNKSLLHLSVFNFKRYSELKKERRGKESIVLFTCLISQE